MIIKGSVHCLFEQSGTFKNEFKKLGYNAFDYDIQNNFNETDRVVDLFAEIEKSYTGGITLFDKMTSDDLILAFFPCIYFETIQQMYFQFTHLNQRGKSDVENIYDAIDRLNNRTRFHTLLLKLVGLCKKNNLRLIIENPATEPNYLITGQNFYKPSLIDKNRMFRGDYFKKPTAYWYFNCEPTYGESYQHDKKQKNILDCKQGIKSGICSEERSMISTDYARNFICDFILGKEQSFGQGMLF